MKQQLNEIKKMQRIAGLITESEYQESLIRSEEKKEVSDDVNENSYLMAKNPDVKAKVDKIISLLIDIDVDGETMEYILGAVGMDDQIANQLVHNKAELNEEKYAEPIVMIQNIVNHWFDGGIKADAALIRIEKILQGNYEDESGEGFDKTKIIKNAVTIELYQGTTLVGPKENEAAARELAKKIEAEMKNAYKGAKGSGSASDAMDARDEAVYDFEDELNELGFEIE